MKETLIITGGIITVSFLLYCAYGSLCSLFEKIEQNEEEEGKPN